MTDSLYDLSILREIDGDEYVLQVVNIFLEEASSEIEAIKKAYAVKDMQLLCKAAHRLKGSAMVIQANALAELLGSIELAARNGETGAPMELLLHDVKQVYRRLEMALQNEAVLLAK